MMRHARKPHHVAVEEQGSDHCNRQGRLIIREPRELCGEGPVGAALLEMYGRRENEDRSLTV